MSELEGAMFLFSKDWKKYYFKLNKAYFQYFLTKDCSQPVKFFTRNQIASLEEINDEDRTKFIVNFKNGSSWILKCYDDMVRYQWITSISATSDFSHIVRITNPSPIINRDVQTFLNRNQSIYPNVNSDAPNYYTTPPPPPYS